MRQILITLLLSATFILSGCFHTEENVDNNDTQNTTENRSTTYISGVITDQENAKIANASVKINGQVVQTNSDGVFSIENNESAERVIIVVTHPGYLSNSRIVKTSNEFDTTIDIQLDAAKSQLSFSADVGARVTQETQNGIASVTLPANGFIDEEGNPYTGEVTVFMSYYPITTASGRASFPGTFEGIDDSNNTVPIESYGFMNVELKDPLGNPLNLAEGATATLRYPIDGTLNVAPITIPLWYYDNDLGYWIQEGQAELGRELGFTGYIGEVIHFTSWNLDAPGPRAALNGCVENENGDRVANASVQFRALNWDSYVVPTDSNGDISVINIMAERVLTFSAYKKIGDTYYYGEHTGNIYLTPSENRTIAECVVIQPMYELPGTITVTGRTVDFNGLPIANEPIEIYDNNYINVASGISDTNGNFSINFNTTDSIMYRVFGETILLQNKKTRYDVGDIEVFGGECGIECA